MDAGILDLSARAVFVPVRHHSPACARTVRRLARELRPSAILIEGPSDFNPRMAELYLPHRLPVAIYSFIHLGDGTRRAAYHPFCVYSPEWQALQAAAELGVPARFIDLPWREIAAEQTPAHRYSDGELRYGNYIEALCRRVGVEDFDALWDALFEIGDLEPARLLEACHRFCFQARALEREVPPLDLRREAFMAACIREALAEFPGQVLVVTGGFHSHALYRRLADPEAAGPEAAVPEDEEESPVTAEGIALTPYSYERLDNLTGYDSGMPNPGFYHQAWLDAERGGDGAHRRLLALVVEEMRRRKQSCSTADLIAVESMARGLAALRGHARIWRADLVDGITGALVKDELSLGLPHPFLEAVHAVFRGGERGVLAEGAELPPLVHDLRRLLAEAGLEPAMRERVLDLELERVEDLERSRILHRLGVLGIAGFTRAGGTDFRTRAELHRFWEQWRVRWHPEFEAGCIEAALYGPTLEEAAGARLEERAAGVERDAESAAGLLLEAGLMGLRDLPEQFHPRLAGLIRSDPSFYGVTGAIGHLLYLYRYDEALGTAGESGLGGLLAEAWQRGLWLLETLGSPAGRERDLLRGLSALLETLERCGGELGLDGEALVEVLARAAAEGEQSPLLRGAAAGALWTLGAAPAEAVLDGIRGSADAACLGDFLTGLFSMAREAAQRHRELVLTVDAMLMAYGDEQFLEALPALRLAFTYFTPREKHHLARTLLEARGLADAPPLPDLEVSAEIAARALALEARLFAAARRYGLRSGATASEEPA